MHFKKTAAFAAALCMLFAAAPIAPFQNAAETVSLCAEAAESSADLYDFLKNNTSDPASAAIVGNGETLTMSGRVYGAGIRFTSQWNRESSIDLNVKIWMLVDQKIPFTAKVKEVIYDALNKQKSHG